MAKKKKSTAKETQTPNVAGARIAMERMMAGLTGSTDSREAASQDLFYQAMEAETAEEEILLLEKALEIDPANVDALLVVAESLGFAGEEQIELLRQIVDLAAARLGNEAFEELVPHFWGFHETRPYMRARESLAETLRQAGRLPEAIEEYQGMLTLNENDNQGMRDHLLPCLLALDRLEEARALMKRYKDDCEYSAPFAWGRLLESILSGDAIMAKRNLTAARIQNPHVESYLTGKLKVPKTGYDGYSPGSIEEAVIYAPVLLTAWQPHAEAMKWLSEQSKETTKSPALKVKARTKKK